MRPRRRPVGFTARATDDLDEIFLSGVENWGEDRAESYITTLYRRLQEIIEYPEIGRARDDPRSGARSLRVGEHVVYYRITPTKIRITRVPRARQDPSIAIGL